MSDDQPRRRGRPPRAHQGSEAVVPAPVAVTVAAQADDTVAGYIASIEQNTDGVVLVSVTHPAATGDVVQGRYSGVRTANGPKSARWSDGTIT